MEGKKTQQEIDESFIGLQFEANDKRFGIYEIIQFLGTTPSRNKQYRIKFLNTGYEINAYKQNILKGRVSDNSLTTLKIGSKYPSKNHGYVFVKEYLKLENRHQIYRCKFENTGNEYEFRKDHILSGNISDSNLYELQPNMIFPSKNYGDYKIIRRVDNYYKKEEGYKTEKFYEIESISTGEKQICARQSILNGEIYDNKYPSIYGIWYIGGVKYTWLSNPKEYGYLKNMLSRCYNKEDKSYKSYGAKGVRVSEEWHNFQNFCEWYLNEKSKYKIDIDLEIDKDLKCLQKQNKIYSKETCILLPSELNWFLAGEHKTVGVSPKFVDDELVFDARIGINYNQIILGTFKSFEEAKICYALRKKELWLELLKQYTDILPKEIYDLCLQYDFTWGVIINN